MLKLPVAEADFTQREATGEQQWNKVSQELQRQTLEADRVQAILNALDRVLKEADQFGVSRDPATRQRFKAEIDANRRDLEDYRRRLEALRRDIEAGRVRVGFGDQRYAQDDAVRGSFKSLFAREVELCAGGADRDAMEYARAIRGILSNADAVELELTTIRNRQEGEARSTAQTLLSVVEEEAKKIADYQGQLGELDQSARVQIGELAMRSFASIRDRLKKIVLHADVGIAQQAWEVREEQRIRVRDLQRERAQEERKLNDELREVLDDAEVP
jgi:hypothetical protein